MAKGELDQNVGFFQRIENFVYPKNSKYDWYRTGKVQKKKLSARWFKLMFFILVLASLGTGFLMPALLVMTHWWMKVMFVIVTKGEIRGGFWDFLSSMNPSHLVYIKEFPEWEFLYSSPLVVSIQMILSGLIVMSVYDSAATRMTKEFYVDRKDDPENWKCQSKFLSPEKVKEERRLGRLVGFITGVTGTGAYFLDHKFHIAKFYYDINEKGLVYFVLSGIITFMWMDFYGFIFHRTFHKPFLYKHFHYLHHTFAQPTPFCVFAIHPIEFLVLQFGGAASVTFINTHPLMFFTAAIYMSYQNTLSHSGIDFEGELPWIPSAKFHDDHHKLYHCNFGVEMVLWDWLFDTLKRTDRAYGEHRNVGNQEINNNDASKKLK